MVRIGEDVSEKGYYVPGYFGVNQYIRGTWACKKSHGTVVTAPPPPSVVDKSRFEPSVYAHIVTSKYADHLPIHRQAGILARMGFAIAKSTLCDMVRDVALLMTVVLAEMKRQLLLVHYLRTDDTPVDVLPEKGSGKGVTQGRLWVYLTEDGKAVFDFTMSRSRDGPASFLEGFKGYLQGDGYAGYEHICRSGEVVKVGCWAHARRKFVDALDADRTRSAQALRLIGRLYWIESAAQKRMETDPQFDLEALHALRQRRSLKVLGQIKTWLDMQDRDPALLPKSPVRDAVGYALNQWPDLVRYTEDGHVNIDNNGAERALRQVAVGRKNFLFLGSPKGGDSAAVIYSLMGSCKVLGIDPFAYMTDVLTQLAANRKTPPESLTPWAWRDARVNAAVAAAVTPATEPSPGP
jgi:transposase